MANRFTCTTTAIVTTLVLGGGLDAHAQGTAQQIDIPAQPLGTALGELSTETGLQVSAATDVTQGLRSFGVRGTMTPREALVRMLSGTGLVTQSLGSDGVLITATNDTDAAADNAVASADQVTGDDIVVEGERVARSVFDTNASVTVVTGEDISKKGTIRDTRSVVGLLPNVFDAVGTNNAPTIRGLDSTGPSTGSGAFTGGARPRGSVVVDGRALSSSEISFAEISVWDLDQVEAFNGPQTTTNGTNSLAGAIFVNTRDPVFDVEAAGRFYGGNYATYGASLMFNAPIIEDQLALRLTFDHEKQNTWRKSVAVPPNANLDNHERTNLRGKLLFEPEAIPGFSTMFTLNYSEDSGPQTLLSDPPSERRESTNPGEASFLNQYFSGIFDTEYAFSDGLTFSNRFQFTDSETTRQSGDPTLGSLTLNGAEIGNEARINFEAFGGQITGVAGAAWLRRDESVPFTFLAPGPVSGIIDGTNESYGLFGEVTWSATDDLHLTLGGRYQVDKSKRFIPEVPFLLPGGIDFDETFSAFLPKAALAYDITPELRIGTLVSRAYNPGGVIDVFGLGGFAYDEESLWSFEVFARSAFWDDRVQMSANAFHTRVKDYQIFTNVLVPGFEALGPQGKIENADKVVTYGLDLSADADVADDLELNMSLGLLKTEIKQFTRTNDPVVGNALPRAPTVTFSIGAQYDVTDQLSVGGDLRYVGAYYGNARNAPDGKAGNFVVVDLNASYDVNAYFQIFGTVNNLFNTDYTVQAFGTGANRRVGFGDPFEFTLGGEVRF